MESKNKTKQIIKKDQICSYQKQGLGKGELDESSQNVQTSSYKINTYEGYNVQMMTIINNAVWYTGMLLRKLLDP